MARRGFSSSTGPERVTEALLLRRFDFGDTSQIGHLLTPERGRVAVLAKGIKKPSAAMKGPMDLFQWSRVSYRPRRNSGLALLTRYEPISGFRGLREALPRIYAGFFLLELLREITREENPEPLGFRHAIEGLAVLERVRPEHTLAPTLACTLALLKCAGFAIATANCARCGEGLPKGAIAFDPALGGGICSACLRTVRHHVDRLSGGSRALMDVLAAESLQATPRLRPTRGQVREIWQCVRSFLLQVVERPLKSEPFFLDPRHGGLRVPKGLRSGPRVDGVPGRS